jgi:hypothetical protein
MGTVASVPGAFRVRVWHITSSGRGHEGGNRCQRGASVGYPLGTVILGIVLLDEPANTPRLISVAGIVAGIIGLKIATPA